MIIIQQLAILVVAFFNFFLSFSVLLRNKVALINRIFFLLEIAYGLWSLSLFFYQFPIFFTSLIWIKITYVLVFAFILLILAFSFVFPVEVSKKTFYIGSILSIAYLVFSTWLLFFTPWFVENVVYSKEKGLQTILGPGYLWWSILTWFPLVTAAINFIGKNSQVTARQKIQMRYFWIGFTIFGISVCIPDVVIPIFWHTTQYFFISPIANMIFSAIIAYIVLRHRFLDIRRIVVQTVSKSIVLLVLGFIYFSIAYLLGIIFFPAYVHVTYILFVISFALVIRTVIHSSELVFEKKLQHLIDPDVYEREDVLDAISKIITTTTDFKELTREITKELVKVIPSSPGSILLISTENKTLHFYSPQGDTIAPAPKEHLELIAETKDRLVVTDELPDGLVKTFFASRNVGLCAPLNVRDQLFGYLVLYRKTSGNLYTAYDVKTIELITPQISVALQNAMHIEEIENFNKSLKKEVKKATEDLLFANKKLVQLDKEKDDFISMASHELRTPTTVIKTFLWILLKKEKSLSEDARKKVEKLYHLSNHLGEMIKELLDVSMIESGKMQYNPESFDIVELTKEVIDGVKATITEKKQITVAQTKHIFVYADRSKIYQVIGNLITNAIKYTNEESNISVDFEKNGNSVTTSVSDNGMGIDKQHMEKLFTRFGKVPKRNPADKEIPGSGLGLYISKKIIENSGGNMWVTSKVGQGSTFFFTLPATVK